MAHPLPSLAARSHLVSWEPQPLPQATPVITGDPHAARACCDPQEPASELCAQRVCLKHTQGNSLPLRITGWAEPPVLRCRGPLLLWSPLRAPGRRGSCSWL